MNLVPLYEEAIQFNNFNGTVLAAGKVEVWYLGRTRKADIYADVAGETPIPNPLDLNDLGMQEVYVNPAFNYTLVVYDPYGAELFSVDKYLQGAGDHTTSNVVVQPSEHIGVSAWTVGEVQIYQPYLVGEVGKTYEGISPIVVNNVEDKISAQHVPLGVQEPLYFVQDDEEACIIGFSGETLPEGTMNESAFGYQDGQITSYNGTAFSAGNTYEAGSYVDITNNTISVTGLTPVPADTASTGLVASVSADITALIPDTSDMATQTWVNEQGFLTAHQDISNKLDTTAFSTVSGDFLTAIPSEYVTENTLQSGLSSKLDSTAFSTVSGNFLTAHQSLEGYATENWVTSQGYLTEHQSLDGLMSADLLESSGGLITGYNGTAFAGQGGGVTGDFELSAGSGISIVDYPLEQKTVISVTAQGGNPEVEQAVIDNSATWNTVSDKLDTTAFSDVSGTFLTAHQDLSNYQTTAGMTAYQPAGDYLTTADSANFYTTANESGFITGVDLTPYQLTADMTAYQSAGDYLTTADSANFYTTANESGYITGVPDTYLQNTDLTISDGKITEISGVPLSAGDEFPQSATEAIETVTANSADWNGTTETVNINSGVWGGSALPVSAGPGIKVNLVDNTLVFSNDETVLFEGDALHNNATATLSESFTNFEKIKVYGHTDDGIMYPWFTEVPTFSGIGFIGVATNNAGWSKWFGLSVPDTTHIVPHTGYVSTWASTTTGYLSNTWGITRVIGVNRTAGGN